ncbi:dihydroorotate dehydrogenase electron transfer subunit, partial [candidate division WOR-3 bacterium]|nr:dihydroorotate dehydrogenase electron transfer subunit [candidate division WOR-3 bacterium]
GPLGRPAPHPHGQGVLICGGGVGAAPLLMLARTLAPTNRLRILLGARTKSELLLVKEFRALKAKVAVATDDGSAGYNGTVTELAAYEVSGRQPTADSRQQLVAFACGPRPMLADLVSRLDPIPVWGFIEERMGCGTGICYCCALPRRDGGVARFCEDGPVVRLDGVVL